MASTDEQARVEARTGVKFSDGPAPSPPGTIRLDTLKEISPATATIVEQITPSKPTPWWMEPIEHPGIGIAICLLFAGITWLMFRSRRHEERTDQPGRARVIRLRP